MLWQSPKMADSRVLTINGGSSSIKFALFTTGGSLRRQVKGKLERIGMSASMLVTEGPRREDNVTRAVSAPDHGKAAALILDWLDANLGGDELAAIGHRVVHGGPDYSEPQRITPAMVAALQKISAFDPQHLPMEIMLIEAFQRRHAAVAQVACFDTAFHHDLPRVAQLLPIPRRYQAKGLRRYGFHGLSYAYLMQELARVNGAQGARGRIVLAHLGNGASLVAMHEGKPLDTSMGFTPAAGVPMSTRSGDLDPGLAGYFARTENMDAEQFDAMVNSQSGLLGVSETSSDMRDLLERETSDVRAAEAVALFCYQVKKCIGSFAAALGGLDTLVFAGGIGESTPVVRARICSGLAFLGLELDATRNMTGEGVISTGKAGVIVRVMQTDEESMIAQMVCRSMGLPI
jgi:acetate kinase